MYDANYEMLISVIPNKEISRFKAILSDCKELELLDKREEMWTYFEGWDILSSEEHKWCGKAEEFINNLSSTMYIYEDLVVFVEKKGPDGWFYPKITLLSLSKGSVKFN